MTCHKTTMTLATQALIWSAAAGLFAIEPQQANGATPQQPDTIVYGGKEFAVWQLPLEEVIRKREAQQGGILLRSRNSSLNRGYSAKWEVTRGYLWLLEFHGKKDGESVPISTIIEDARLPLKATWFTGVLHIYIGDLDSERHTYPVVVRIKIVKGRVEDVSAIEDAPPVYSLDGSEEIVE